MIRLVLAFLTAAVSAFIVTLAAPLLLYYVGRHCRF
jgi:hypothetical protein